MTYLVIDDFRQGMDRRKDRISGAPGALWDGINGHITRGGEFERRKKFVKKYVLPVGTFGMAQINKQLYVFGSASLPANIPAGVNYQQLAHTATANMSEIIDATSFGGKVYAVAAFDNGDIYHYYNGARVTDWDTVAAGIADNTSIALSLAQKIALDPRYVASAVDSTITIIAAVSGIPFTITASTVDGGSNPDQTITLTQVQANVVAVPETQASVDVTITAGTAGIGNMFASLTINSISLMNAAVAWNISNTYTAAAVANAVNVNSGNNGGYHAIAVGAVITIMAPPGVGALANAYTCSAIVGGTVAISGPAATMTGGINAIDAVAQVYTAAVGGTFEGGDQFNITIDSVLYAVTGLASGTGITALTYQGKVYSVTTSLLEFSAVGDPTMFSTGTGSGFINMTNQNSDNDALVCISQYQNRIAIFSRDNIQIWLIAVDPSQSAFQQSVENTGALSNRSVLQYGNIDVFYLHSTGVRSLRARDASNAPAVSDVGVAIDTFIQEFMATLSGSQIERACSAIEPVDGRYWLAMHNRIFVYSFFPGSKISAWTYYDLTDEIGSTDISDMVKAGNRTFLRAGDNIYLYGGDTGQIYPDDDEIVAVASIPFLSAQKPDTDKGVQGFDMGSRGVWQVNLLPLPADDTVKLNIGTFTKPTYSLNDNPIQQTSSLFALEFTCSKAGYARISNATVVFEMES